MSLYIFARLQGNLWNHFSSYRTGTHIWLRLLLTMFKGPKLKKQVSQELRFLCFANCIMVIYICIKFQENISNSFQVTERTQIYYRNHYFQSSKGHNSKSRLTRVTVLVFCTLSHDTFLKFHQNLWNGFQLIEQTGVHRRNVLHVVSWCFTFVRRFHQRFSTYRADTSTW